MLFDLTLYGDTIEVFAEVHFSAYSSDAYRETGEGEEFSVELMDIEAVNIDEVTDELTRHPISLLPATVKDITDRLYEKVVQ